MCRSKTARRLFSLVGVALVSACNQTQQPQQPERETMYGRYLEFPSYVRGGSITPRWMADGSSFWYVEGAPDDTVIYTVNPEANTRTALFDTRRLRQALAEALGHEPPYRGLPFSDFGFLDGERAVTFTIENTEFVLQRATYAITRGGGVSDAGRTRPTPEAGDVRSPDGRWSVGITDDNVWLRSADDGRSVRLTSDGVADYPWGDWSWEKQVEWSPDSSMVAVKRRDLRQSPKIPLVHHLTPTAGVDWVPYPFISSEPTERVALFLIDIASRGLVRVETGDEPEHRIVVLEWLHDGSELYFLRTDRYVKELEVMAANPATGSTKVVLTEINEAFDDDPKQRFTLLENERAFIWRSQRSGWNHLYLYASNGRLIRQLTEGEFSVVRVVAVDQRAGWVYFIGHGDRQRVYDTHLYRVDLEGSEVMQLTQATGQHDSTTFGGVIERIQMAPSRRFFLDTHSTTARPPTVEVRRADGTLLQTLTKADVERLRELKWAPPEEFVVKAADGRTDLYGVVYKPYDFDATKKYPVIEYIYGGRSIVPRTFTGRGYREEKDVWPQAMAQLGFITFIVDGRGPFIGGTRGTEFERVTYGSWGRHEIPDHVAALKQLAENRPYMDLNRVGIFGLSMGGYYVVRALLQAPDVYQVGIAVAPVIEVSEHANYVWLGPPELNGKAYAYASNLRLAANLKGKLLLVHGTSDTAVPFSHTMKIADALNRAGKPYDLVVLPEWGHWESDTKALERSRLDAYRRYFQEHLKP